MSVRMAPADIVRKLTLSDEHLLRQSLSENCAIAYIYTVLKSSLQILFNPPPPSTPLFPCPLKVEIWIRDLADVVLPAVKLDDMLPQVLDKAIGERLLVLEPVFDR